MAAMSAADGLNRPSPRAGNPQGTGAHGGV